MNEQELRMIDKEIKRVESILEEFPSNEYYKNRRFKSYKNEKYEKWYYIDQTGRHYIPKSERKYAKKLAQKTYFELLLKDLKKQRHILTRSQNYTSKSRKYLESSNNIMKFLTEYAPPSKKELFEWANAQYNKNTSFPEQLNVPISKGIYVRSKSESDIYCRLIEKQIPFRYEASLQLSGKIYYPDFTIRHPDTGEIFYWEHFGRMDQFDYANNTFKKLQIYNQHNIIPGINLITTYETLEHPLGISTINFLIEQYFG